MTANDRAALKLALELTRAEPERTQQVDDMLAERPWEEVASFCAYHRQHNALNLRPWEPTPSQVHERGDGNIPENWRAAARLAKQMQALGVSAFYPDPLAAINEAKRRRRLDQA